LAILPVLELPNPILRRRAKKVRRIDKPVLKLAYSMVETMKEANGVGLAANQVGELRRVIVIQLPEEDEARIYINPEIVQREGEREVEEGCLSIPGYRANIKRSVWVKFRALDHSATVVKLKAEDILSQALEHEVDHLDGILYIDHMESHEKLIPIDSDSEDSAKEVVEQHSEHFPAPPSGPFKESDSGLLVPDTEDSRETPATLKIK
jgi:peptide deformylase